MAYDVLILGIDKGRPYFEERLTSSLGFGRRSKLPVDFVKIFSGDTDSNFASISCGSE